LCQATGGKQLRCRDNAVVVMVIRFYRGGLEANEKTVAVVDDLFKVAFKFMSCCVVLGD